ncbi:MAG: MGMT family protein [Candidatus Latescibacterota bacterium]|nr:MAG: MGMT family protein [Candidatus Latescibacterota bacterium]
MKTESTYATIYAVVRRIPRGRVATYGQVAALARLPGHARQVGYALHALPDASGVPWHRVINAQGRVSRRAEPGWEELQRQLLEGEGVRFDSGGRTSLVRFGWRSRGAPTALRRRAAQPPGQPASARPGAPRPRSRGRRPRA